MALDIINEKGVPLDDQELDWRAMVDLPYSKLDDDAFTRVRVILMNGIEAEAIRFSHACARMNRDLQIPLARVRRIEQHQQTLVNWLNPPDQDPLETTIGFEQTAIEITAAVALREPDPYLQQVYRFGMLEDFDHLYRYAALMDRLQGKDVNNILQSYTDVRPGRPTVFEHRHPEDEIRESYRKGSAEAITKLNALTIISAEHQVHDYYMNIGPLFSDPVARALYAEIASIEEQHVTQYESLADTEETWLEKWLLHEATEVFNYYSCMEQESNARIKAIWERFVDYELGQLHFVRELFQRIENRDPAEILPNELPEPMEHTGHRQFIRDVLGKERELRADGPKFVPATQLPADHRSARYAERVNRHGVPSEIVAAGWRWMPGTAVEKDVTGAPARRTIQ
jgi:hypothetical protein